MFGGGEAQEGRRNYEAPVQVQQEGGTGYFGDQGLLVVVDLGRGGGVCAGQVSKLKNYQYRYKYHSY